MRGNLDREQFSLSSTKTSAFYLTKGTKRFLERSSWVIKYSKLRRHIVILHVGRVILDLGADYIAGMTFAMGWPGLARLSCM